MHAHKTPGKLITFCGLDGCGKSTQISMLNKWLQSEGVTVQITKQPTETVRRSDMFRAFIDQQNHDAYDFRAMSLNCASDRVQHCNKVILPMLEAGDTVLSDRYFYSCLVSLQVWGYTRERWIYDIARNLPKPDLAIFLDVPVELAVQRVRTRAAERDRHIDLEMQRRWREQYIKVARKNGALLLDSSKAPEETFAAIVKKIKKRFGLSFSAGFKLDQGGIN